MLQENVSPMMSPERPPLLQGNLTPERPPADMRAYLESLKAQTGRLLESVEWSLSAEWSTSVEWAGGWQDGKRDDGSASGSGVMEVEVPLRSSPPAGMRAHDDEVAEVLSPKSAAKRAAERTLAAEREAREGAEHQSKRQKAAVTRELLDAKLLPALRVAGPRCPQARSARRPRPRCVTSSGSTSCRPAAS